MKEKTLNILVILLSIFVLFELLIDKSMIYESIMDALKMWVKSLIPALFPFFIISDILINYNITYYIPKIIKKICKYVFNISDNMLSILFLSMLSGFPSSARNTRYFYGKGLIDLDEANHILIFSHFANPVFILSTVAVFFFHNERLGIILLISHYLSNIVLGICFRNKFTHDNYKNVDILFSNKFSDVFMSAIKNAIDTILMICGILVVFLTLTTIVINILNLNIYNAMIVKSIFEITIGLQSLGILNIGIYYKGIIASMVLAFGGICVHMQVISYIIGSEIKYRYFFMGRIFQMIIAPIITYLILIICGF